MPRDPLTIDPDIGRRILAARKRRELSQVDLAADVGLHAQQLHRIESGKAWVRAELLRKIARRLDVSGDELLGLPAEPALLLSVARGALDALEQVVSRPKRARRRATTAGSDSSRPGDQGGPATLPESG